MARPDSDVRLRIAVFRSPMPLATRELIPIVIPLEIAIAKKIIGNIIPVPPT